MAKGGLVDHGGANQSLTGLGLKGFIGLLDLVKAGFGGGNDARRIIVGVGATDVVADESCGTLRTSTQTCISSKQYREKMAGLSRLVNSCIGTVPTVQVYIRRLECTVLCTTVSS